MSQETTTEAIETVRAVRLREIIARDGLANVARKAGRASSQLSAVSRGIKPFGERLARMLERDLELPPGYFDAIDAPKPVVKVTSSKMNFGAVPLVEIGDVLSENKKIEDNRIVFPFSDTKSDFALIIRDSSMAPMFKEGDVAYFSKEDQIPPGSYVLAGVDGQILFRKLVSKSYRSFTLIPENGDFPQVTSDDTEITLIAKLVAAYRRF